MGTSMMSFFRCWTFGALLGCFLECFLRTSATWKKNTQKKEFICEDWENGLFGGMFVF